MTETSIMEWSAGWISSSARRWGAPLAAILITLCALAPAWQHGFVNWGDKANFETDSHEGGLSGKSVARVFSGSMERARYQPMAWLSYEFDRAVFGVKPTGYHAHSVLLHLLNTLLLYGFVLMLLRRMPRVKTANEERRLHLSVLAGVLWFAIHPLRVEAVAWVTARGDLLAAFFSLLSLCLYVRYVDAPAGARRWAWYAAAAACIVLSLFSGPAALSLPLWLLLLDVYPLRRFGTGASARQRLVFPLVEKVPFLILSIGGGYLAWCALGHAPVSYAPAADTAVAPLIRTAFGLCYHLCRTVLPVALSPIGGQGMGYDLSHGYPWLFPLLVAGITVALIVLGRRWPALPVVWLGYVVATVPALLLEPVGPGMLPDHAAYLPAVPAALLGAGFLFLFSSGPLRRAWAGPALVAGVSVVLLSLAVLCFRQTGVWRDSVSLWRHTVGIYPDSYTANLELAHALSQAGRDAEAVPHYEKALRQDPDNLSTLRETGAAYETVGLLSHAIEKWQQILTLSPDQADALFRIGRASLDLDRTSDAERYLKRTIDVSPLYQDAYYEMATIYARQGNIEEAQKWLLKAREISMPAPR